MPALSARSTIGLAAALALTLGALDAAPARAQSGAQPGTRPGAQPAARYGTPYGWDGPAGGSTGRDDPQWEERRVPYPGGPIRPGAQLEGSVNGWTWWGALGTGAGLVLGVVIAAANDRGYGAIPLVGPWLAVGNVGNDALAWEGLTVAGMVFAGILQPVGIAVMAIALANPNLYLVLDAPVGAGDGYARVRVAPFAAGAEAGLTLSVEAL